jgi:hypothetical protein
MTNSVSKATTVGTTGASAPVGSNREKAASLLDFLIENPIDGLVSEVYPSQRFRDRGFSFTITAVSGEKFAEYQKQAVAIGRHHKASFDSKTFNEQIILNHTSNPDFRNLESIQRAGCRTPEEFMYKVLLAGEISELSRQISSLSGFDSDVEELRDEVKNS